VRLAGAIGDRNQLGRRNLSPEDFRIISGRIYNRRKKAANDGGKGTLKQSQTVAQIEPQLSTSETVAAELGVSRASIERNAQRARVHDALLDAGDTEAAEIAKGATQADIAAVKGKPAEQAAVGAGALAVGLNPELALEQVLGIVNNDRAGEQPGLNCHAITGRVSRHPRTSFSARLYGLLSWVIAE